MIVCASDKLDIERIIASESLNERKKIVKYYQKYIQQIAINDKCDSCVIACLVNLKNYINKNG